jgi:uncharacterized membrane protein YgcG
LSLGLLAFFSFFPLIPHSTVVPNPDHIMDPENEKRKTSVEDSTTTTTTKQDEVEKQAQLSDLWRAFQFADRLDWVLNAISLICSIASGAAMPLMTIVGRPLMMRSPSLIVRYSESSQAVLQTLLEALSTLTTSKPRSTRSFCGSSTSL